MKTLMKKILEIIAEIEKQNKGMTPDFYFALDLVKTKIKKL